MIDPKVELLEMSSGYVYSLHSPVNFMVSGIENLWQG